MCWSHRLGASSFRPRCCVAAPTAAGPTVANRKIKLSLIIRQADETEIEVADESLMDIGQGRWEATFGLESKPEDNQDVTLEQLSGVKWLLDNRTPDGAQAPLVRAGP